MKNEVSNISIVLIEFQKQWTEKGILHNKIKKELEGRSILENTRNLVSKSREYGIKIIHAPLIINPKKKKGWYARLTFGKFFTKDTWKSQMTPGLYKEGDTIVKGRYSFDAFVGSDLEESLKINQINTLYLCGFTTNQCIRRTMNTALKKGFTAFFLTDCTAAFNEKKQRKIENLFQTRKMTSKEFLNKMNDVARSSSTK